MKSICLMSFIIIFWDLSYECPNECQCRTSPGLGRFSSLPKLDPGLVIRCINVTLNQYPHHSLDANTLYVELHNNSIKTLEVYDDQYHTLNVLLIDARFNNITSIGRFDADFISHLNLDHNNLIEIPRTSRSILSLSLAYNQIENDTNENILFYLKLIRLQLSYNRLKNIFEKFPSTIEYLYLAGNDIRTININSLQNLIKLKVINLENNKFLQMGLTEVEYLSKINYIELGKNRKSIFNSDLLLWCKQNQLNETIIKKYCNY